MSTLLLIDGSNYLYRAYHGLPDLRTSQGEPTGAIKGFANMLQMIKNMVKPDLAACVFDAHGPTFRNTIYTEYKANRPPMPEELASQVEPIFEMVKAQGWPFLQVPGIEADDVIGTLARQAKAQGLEAGDGAAEGWGGGGGGSETVVVFGGGDDYSMCGDRCARRGKGSGGQL